MNYSGLTKWVLTLLLLLFIQSSKTFAQEFQIKGTLLDSLTRQPMNYTSVALYVLPDSGVVTGTITDSTGFFQIRKIPRGHYFLKIRFVGYNTIYIDNINSGNDINLGTLFMNMASNELNEISVYGQKSTSIQTIDKQIFDASKFKSGIGGTAIDILRNMPSVMVNANGEITMRGSSGFIVLLNGKPVQNDPATILAQIPANSVEDIEIITSPSAKYDPDGKSGIINIKTKTGSGNGLYVIADVTYGLPSIQNYDNKESQHRYGGGFTISEQADKWTWSAGANYQRDDIAGRRIGHVTTNIDNMLTTLRSEGERSFDNYKYFTRMSVSYTPNAKNTFGGGFYAGRQTKYRLADIVYHNTREDLLTGNTVSDLQYFNSNLQTRKGDFLIGSLDYQHAFSNKSTLKTTALYEYSLLGGPTKNRNLGFPDITDTIQYTYNDNSTPLHGFRFNLDYSLPVSNGKIEMGYQYRFLNHSGDFVYEEKIIGTENFVVNPEFSNNISMRRRINSVYAEYSGKASKLSYNGGLRFEYAERELKTGQSPEPFTLKLYSLFPSASVFYNLTDNLDFKAGYSRRIDRTTTFKMNPFPEREHSETLEQGDPNLLPEFINEVEAGLIRHQQHLSIYGTAYYQRIRNVINRVNNIYNDSILNRIYTNAGDATAVGFETGTELNPFPWWNVYLGANIYNYHISGKLFNDLILVNTSSLIYLINFNTTFHFGPSFLLQANVSYISRKITAQGEDGAFLSPNLTLQRSFWNGRLTATMQWKNIDMGLLNTNAQRITTYSSDFYTTTNYIYEVDVLMLNLSFRLDKPSRKINFIKSEFGEKEF